MTVRRRASRWAWARSGRNLRAIAVILGSFALAGTCGAGIGWGASTHGIGWDSALNGATGKRVSVVVRARPGHEAAAEAAVTRLGGHVKLQLRVINGFSA